MKLKKKFKEMKMADAFYAASKKIYQIFMKKIKKYVIENKLNIIIWLAFMLILLKNTFLYFEYFFIRQFIIMLFISLGVALEMMSGDFDLSFAAQISGATVIGAYLLKNEINLYVTVLFILLLHILGGAVKSFLMIKLKMPSIIFTLALQMIISKTFLIVSNENNIIIPDKPAYYNNNMFWVLMAALTAVLLLCVHWFLYDTYYGKYCRMLGENTELMEKNGLNCFAASLIIHSFAAVFFTMASLLFIFQTVSGSAYIGSNYLYKVLAALCLGGIGSCNGEGRISGIVAGTVSMVLLIFILTSFNYVNKWETIVEGMIILAGLYMGRIRKTSENYLPNSERNLIEGEGRDL